LVIDEVKANIEEWLINFLEVPHPALGNWSPCPYARKARLANKYSVRIGTSLAQDMINVAEEGMGNQDVYIYVYNPDDYDPEEFEDTIDNVNEETLVPIDMLALSDHPGVPEVVNGVKFNHGKYALALVQSRSKLHSHAKILGKKGFYNGWDEEYLTGLFSNREDPRL
jgi:hypothetical protein